jgi:carnitine O-palmitoyltransferase 1
MAEESDGYTKEGHCIGKPEFEPPPAMHLKWDLPSPALELINSCVHLAQNILNDVDLRIFVHDAYGKGFMKVCKVSPDAYLQMALQLAYFRDSGKFCLTYEASMTRLYREGRTETVRPCTVESSVWVRAMEDKNATVSDKINLFRNACAVHQRGYQDAMCGKGIDRHLFCLYVISKYLEIDSPFLKEVLSEPWRLSTSQTPHGQTTRLNLKKHPGCISAGGGFGPVADDGYGVSYIIAGEDMIFFHISSKKSSPETDSSHFARQIEKALADMKQLFSK